MLDEVADLLEILSENPFRVRAYRTAARTVETLGEAAEKSVLRDPAALAELPRITKDLETVGSTSTSGRSPGSTSSSLRCTTSTRCPSPR